MEPSTGIFYIASGREFYKEAVNSANSLRDVMPDSNISIATDQEDIADCFDKHIFLKEPKFDFMDKIINMENTPYDRTLFVDTDTYFHQEVNEVFSILDNFKLAVAHDPDRSSSPVNISDGFAEYNTGVLLYRLDSEVLNLFSEWEEIYRKGPDNWNDQPAFRKALFESGIPYYTFTPEYNCRSWFPGYLCGTAKIIHGQHSDISEVGNQLNSTQKMRAHRYRWGRIELYPVNGNNGLTTKLSNMYFLYKNTKEYYKKYGIKKTLKRGFEIVNGKYDK